MSKIEFEIKGIGKFKKSDLWITKSLGELSEWNVDNIIERQNQLSELAVNTWSLKLEENY